MSQINVAKKIQEIYAITKELEAQFPGRRFTPDGHLVGSIGEVLVAEYYGLRLLPNSTETHDAISPDGKLVQIKATQGDTSEKYFSFRRTGASDCNKHIGKW